VLLSLLVVLVPTVCVLWFMARAVENRRLVVRRVLADSDITIARERLEAYWRQQAAELEKCWSSGQPASKAFEKCVLSKLADSVVCYGADEKPVYPAPAQAPPAGPAEQEVDWGGIERMEFEQQQIAAAAAAYEGIAAAHGDPAADSFDAHVAARALLAQARCLVKVDQHEAAIRVLAETLGRQQYRRAVDSGGRLIVVAAELRALELIADPTDPRFRTVVERLSQRLGDYSDPLLAGPQRGFLMERLRQLVAERLRPVKARAAAPRGWHLPSEQLQAWLRRAAEFPTLEAERLAATFCEANPLPSKDPVVRQTQSPGLWQLPSSNRRVYALLRTETVVALSQQAISARPLGSGATVTPLPPGASPSSNTALDSGEAGGYLPGWRLVRSFAGGEDAEPVSDAEIAAYFWTGTLVIAAMSVFAVIIARAFRRQMRLTRLRNDLVASVSHELKTPLSSMRLLVDTLLDEEQFQEQKTREYLQLVAKENMRLSRLIDNFLAFSRMERNKYAFEFAEVSAGKVVEAAVETVGERLQSSGCRLQVEISPDLPPLTADADALVTVLLNLLDNAYKYSGEEKQIALRAYPRDGNVCFEVTDRGIGLSRSAAKKVFKRFYQVDRRLSREAGGVGLGLSIVQFIVHAHGGTVGVRSQPGQGSTFTVTIPCTPADSRTLERRSG
jgi:signal transduction histidine kinase